MLGNKIINRKTNETDSWYKTPDMFILIEAQECGQQVITMQ